MIRRSITAAALLVATLGLVGCRNHINTKTVIERPEDVALIGNLPIGQARIIGVVSTGDNFLMGSRVEAAQVIAKLREEAAAIGANALLMTPHEQARVEGGKPLQFFYKGELYTIWVFHTDEVKTAKCMAAWVNPYPRPRTPRPEPETTQPPVAIEAMPITQP
jgi:hypothetical protein